MKVSPEKTNLKPISSAHPDSCLRKNKPRKHEDLFSVRVKVENKNKIPPKMPNFVPQMLDSVRIRRDVPGTEFKKGMQGAVVSIFGIPPVAVDIEVIDPPYINDIQVEDIELVRRY